LKVCQNYEVSQYTAVAKDFVLKYPRGQTWIEAVRQIIVTLFTQTSTELANFTFRNFKMVENCLVPLFTLAVLACETSSG
jgi:hypothetical protein